MSRARDLADLGGSADAGGLTGANALINGQFAVAQRGTSFTSGSNDDTDYTLDRWKLFSDGNDVVDVTQETSTVPTNRQYAIALDVETANKKFGIAQIIEQKNCVNLIGETVTLSFQAKVSATTNLDNVKAAIIAWDGTADTLTGDMISAWGAEGTDPTLAANFTYENTPANLNLTTSYATYSVTASVDTASAKNIIVFIWSDVTTTSAGEFLYLSDVKLEAGETATPFDHSESYGDELARCQRYYQYIGKGENYGHMGLGIAYNSTGIRLPVQMRPVGMRKIPSIASSGSIRTAHQVSSPSITGVSIATSESTDNIVGANLTVASGLTQGYVYGITNNGDANAYIEFSAEL